MATQKNEAELAVDLRQQLHHRHSQAGRSGQILGTTGGRSIGEALDLETKTVIVMDDALNQTLMLDDGHLLDVDHLMHDLHQLLVTATIGTLDSENWFDSKRPPEPTNTFKVEATSSMG